MRKIIALFLLLMLVIFLFGCRQTSPQTPQKDTEAEGEDIAKNIQEVYDDFNEPSLDTIEKDLEII